MKVNRPEFRNPWHWARVLALLITGAIIGCLGAFVQEETITLEVRWGSLMIPWGMLLVWAALISTIRAGAWGTRSRMGAWAILIGWLVATITFSAENASGALVITSGVREAVYVIGGVILGAFAATFPVHKVAIDPTAPVH